MRAHRYFVAEPEAVKTYGEREVCSSNAAGKREYKARTTEMWERQGGICAICGNWIELRYAQLDHQAGRGHGGGKRDDRTVVDGEWNNAAVHGKCNMEKGSTTYQWVSGKYLPVLSRDKEAA